MRQASCGPERSDASHDVVHVAVAGVEDTDARPAPLAPSFHPANPSSDLELILGNPLGGNRHSSSAAVISSTSVIQ